MANVVLRITITIIFIIIPAVVERHYLTCKACKRHNYYKQVFSSNRIFNCAIVLFALNKTNNFNT